MKAGLLLLSSVLATCSPLQSYAFEVAIDYFAEEVIGIHDVGIFGFARTGSYRLWGVVPDTPYLRSLTVGKQVFCAVVGQSRSHHRSVIIVNCSLNLDDDPEREDLSSHLMSVQKGVEICSETLNYFGSCAEKLRFSEPLQTPGQDR
jgi:hypothetical protein